MPTGLVAFHARLSPETIYYRFFAPYPQLSERDVRRFTTVDHSDRVAIIALVGEDMIGVVRYDRVTAAEAEIAFSIEDAHQGRGVGSVLLEHCAAAARERGISRFVADVLPTNRRMIRVFSDAGYRVTSAMEDGVVRMAFELEPTETSLAVTQAREHRAEARSVERLLRPGSVAVVGAGRDAGSVGQSVLRHILAGDFAGPVYAVNSRLGPGETDVAGVAAYPSIDDVPGPVDLAVVAVPADSVQQVIRDCARKGVRGLVVVSAGYAETGAEGRTRQHLLVRTARVNGMRVVGPNSFGMINNAEDVRLNASLSPVLPGRGRLGFFSQSGALGVAILEAAVARGLGLSTFVSAGNRADLSGNDLLQYWEDDAGTDVVLLYLESIGNPRKFSRIARRVSRIKPVIAVKSGRATQGVPLGHAVRHSSLPPAALDALFAQAGVIRVENISELFDVAQVLVTQPLPAGDRVAVVGNSDALALLASDACYQCGLSLVGNPVPLRPDATAEEFDAALAAVFGDPGVDSVVTVFIPPLVTRDEEVARVLASRSAGTDKTVVSTFLGMRGVPEQLRGPGAGAPAAGSVPSYPTPEEAVRALAAATRYAEWRRRPAGKPPEGPDAAPVRAAGARHVVEAALARFPQGTDLSSEELLRLLACYGIELEPSVEVRSVDEAALAAGTEAVDRLVVQRMAAPGVAVVVATREDPLFGPVVTFGLGGVATELLEDRAYRIPPLEPRDAAEMVRSVRAAPLLFGYRGAEPVDVTAVEGLLLRVSRLGDDLPELAHLELDPVLVTPDGLTVLGATARVATPASRTDRGPRSLPG